MIELNKPIQIFYSNLLRMDVVVSVRNGKLHVAGSGLDNLSPAARQEIIRRKDHLIAMLAPAVPIELEPYFGRMLSVKEVEEAIEIASRIDARIQTTPVNCGWIVLMK